VFFIPLIIFGTLMTVELTSFRHTQVPASGAIAETVGLSLASQDASVPHDGNDAGEGGLDLYGNEITDAVAEYKLDATGSLYELHSPQTELPHLASPKS
jgi:hypothetical protein